MKTILITFIMLFALSSCVDSEVVKDKDDNKKEKTNIVVESEIIKISETENQPNF